MLFKNFFGHLGTICRHKHLVFVHCCKCGIVWRGLVHDLSKFSPTEFIPGVKYYQGTKSPNEKEREVFGYSRAWMHHKGRNRHHYEYWFDYNIKTHRNEPVKMPPVFLAEMVCDRMAASKTYQKEKYTDSSPLEYYQNSTLKHGNAMHPETAKKLVEILTVLSEKGENAAFDEVRKMLRKGKY